MKKLIALLLAAIGLAVAPLAGADTGSENSSDAHYLRHTGGISPQ